MKKFAVTIVSPPGYIHSAVFREVAESIHYGLLSLGHDCVLTADGNLPGRQHIVLGSNLLPGHPIPLAPDAILYNLEQVDPQSSWFRPALIDIFRQYSLWDYSHRNVAELKHLGVHVAHVLPIGYVKQLTRIKPSVHRDIDVLFFGSVNPRRFEIMERLRAAGLNAVAVFGAYGEERDALIARSKLLLNVHFYEAKVLEMVRISYLLANGCAVLSERSSDRSEDESLGDAVAFADYDDLVGTALALINNPEHREQLARRGFEVMSSRLMSNYLRAALDQPASS